VVWYEEEGHKDDGEEKNKRVDPCTLSGMRKRSTKMERRKRMNAPTHRTLIIPVTSSTGLECSANEACGSWTGLFGLRKRTAPLGRWGVCGSGKCHSLRRVVRRKMNAEMNREKERGKKNH
jgi:hypothetical protein